MAQMNHQPSPRRNPRPFPLTRSRTMRPSRCATPTLSRVRMTRKKECRSTMRDSREVRDGKAMLRMARSCLRKTRSTFGLWDGGTGGNRRASALSTSAGVSHILACKKLLNYSEEYLEILKKCDEKRNQRREPEITIVLLEEHAMTKQYRGEEHTFLTLPLNGTKSVLLPSSFGSYTNCTARARSSWSVT